MPYQTADGQRLYTLPEVATLMGVHPVTVWRWIRAGKITPWFTGARNDHYFSARDIHDFRNRYAPTHEGFMPKDPAAREAVRKRKARKA